MYGFAHGLSYTWLMEVMGALTIYFWTIFLADQDLEQRQYHWSQVQKAIGEFDGSAAQARALGVPPVLTGRTRIISAVMLSMFRSTSIMSNAVTNSWLSRGLGVPLPEYIFSSIVGSIPHLAYSVMVGTGLEDRTEPLESRKLYYFTIFLFALVQGLFVTMMIRYIYLRHMAPGDPLGIKAAAAAAATLTAATPAGTQEVAAPVPSEERSNSGSASQKKND